MRRPQYQRRNRRVENLAEVPTVNNENINIPQLPIAGTLEENVNVGGRGRPLVNLVNDNNARGVEGLRSRSIPHIPIARRLEENVNATGRGRPLADNNGAVEGLRLRSGRIINSTGK